MVAEFVFIIVIIIIFGVWSLEFEGVMCSMHADWFDDVVPSSTLWEKRASWLRW